MRMFIAIPVPDSIKQHARMLRNDIGIVRADIKWVEYENYHLTLKFMGEVQAGRLPEIKAALRQAADSCPAFNLSGGGLGFFPKGHKPRVIWMGIRGELDKAEFLAERVDAYLASLGFTEEKEHRFHLTLGRIRSEVQNRELLKQAQELSRQDKLTAFRVEQFQVMQSTLTQSGPVYNVLETFTLKG